MKDLKNLEDFFGGAGSDATGPAFLDHLIAKIEEHRDRGGRILVLTLTKKLSEEISKFFLERGFKAFYLHSGMDVMERWEILRKLKDGEIEIVVGINLLREGIDLPEVSLIAVLDADKEWFLRSTTSLVQIIGRAARNPDGEVILYADSMTESMVKSLWETYRRRSVQDEFNKKHGIEPKKAVSISKDLGLLKTDAPLTEQGRGDKKKLKRMTKKEKAMIASGLKSQLDAAIADRKFEEAAKIRDQIKALEED